MSSVIEQNDFVRCYKCGKMADCEVFITPVQHDIFPLCKNCMEKL